MTAHLLAPPALALAVLALGPLLAHLTRRAPREEVRYGAMPLLRRLVRRLRRRRRVEDRALLALRLLALLLAVLAAARPELRWPEATEELPGSGLVVVVLDDSLSMGLEDGGETLFRRARREAARRVRSLPAGIRAGLVAAGGEARVLVEPTDDLEAVASAIEGLEQGYGGTDLAGALRLARRMLGGHGGAVLVYTDEAGPGTVEAARDEIALLVDQGGSLLPRPVRAEDPANLVVRGARYGEGLEGGTVRVDVASYGARDTEAPVLVELPGGVEIAAFVDVPAGGAAEEAVTVPRVVEGGVALARVRDPRLPLDDDYAFHLPRVGAGRVLVVDGDPGATPVASEVYYLERALAPWGARGASRGGITPDIAASAAVGELDPERHAVVFLANVADPGAAAARLLEFVRAGGGLVISVGNNVTAERYDEPLAFLLPARLDRPRALSAPGEAGVRTELPDTSLELFRPFARAGRSGFSRVRWRRVFAVHPYEEGDGVRTLMRLVNGMPLLVERRVGRGRVLLFLGTLDLDWGNFPLQAVFMPWVQRLVGYLGGEATGAAGERFRARVGDEVVVPLRDPGLDVSVRGPDGPVPARVRGGAVRFRPERPGGYVVETPGAPPLARVAVNTDPVESDVRPGPALVEVAAEVEPARYLRRLPLHPWLLRAAVLLALAQAALSAALALRARRREAAGAG